MFSKIQKAQQSGMYDGSNMDGNSGYDGRSGLNIRSRTGNNSYGAAGGLRSALDADGQFRSAGG